ncbi:hypothetical protein AMTRI_Chr08g206280 [Amborella trichopoda]
MKKILDEHELIKNLMTREFHKQNAKYCLSLGSMISERLEDKTTPQEIQDTPILNNRAKEDDPNPEAMDSQIPNEESNCSKSLETQENVSYSSKISIPIEDRSPQKVHPPT